VGAYKKARRLYTNRYTTGQAMDTFLSIHQDVITGTLTMFDRIIFKGHLTGLFPDGAFSRFLWSQGVLLKNFKPYVAAKTQSLKEHAQQVAREASRPFIYLQSATTKKSGQSKEDLARSIAEEDQITEGLICVFSVLEPCTSFVVRGNRETHKLEAVRKRRKCLHFYLYLIDPEFGFMHVRLQSWFPFEIQVYINGHEWLAQEMDRQGIAYERYDNCFIAIDDVQAAQELCEHFAHRRWPRVLDAFARWVNPMLSNIKQASFGGYYWVADQCEVATDVMFRDRVSLMTLMPDLFEHTTLNFSAEDVMRFLGRKLHGNFQGDVTTDLKKRPEGRRVKHRMKRNSIKMYDKLSVLRIETTLNNPREFKVPKVVQTPEGHKWRWKPMGKGVANFWRFWQVASQSNRRYLEALAQVQRKGEAVQVLDDLCQSRIKDGKRYARFNPVTEQDCALFAAAMAGEHIINGFRNRDLRTHLYNHPASTSQEAKRRCARVSRLIAKLRGHGLVAKVKDARLYRVTPRGHRVMSAALSFRRTDFPQAFSMVS
jgi:hypothetical protein